MLVDERERVQRSRIQWSNRVNAVHRGDDTVSEGELWFLQSWAGRYLEIETQLNKDIKQIVSHEPIYPALSNISGVGPLLAARIISMVDIGRAATPSALWKYAGFGVTDGRSDRPVKGEKLGYNKRLKTTMFLVGKSLLQYNQEYRVLYDESREMYAERADWPPIRQHRAALRRMIKRFLAHLWLVWRGIEGLPTVQPYVFEHMAGHVHQDRPEQYGWRR